jgi:phosphatidate cytidylyltransferase
MDCQFIMGCFAFMYYHNFIAQHKLNVGDVLELAITGLTPDEQTELVRGVSRYLENQGVWGPEVSCFPGTFDTT